jgi:dTDP-4-dehydrorhamnose reductase
MKILLIGATGQLGSALAGTLRDDEVAALGHAEIEITDPESVRRAFQTHRPELVINTAAFHRVDDCESQVEKSFQVNAFAARGLALACREAGAALVHFSTDYVFGGEKRQPYTEEDRPQPLSVYAASKLAGEHLIAATLPEHFIIRSCGLYRVGGSKSKGGNFVETMLRKAAAGETIRVVDDQVVTPTHTPELARAVARLIRTRHFGLYHITCQGGCSWYEFAQKIFALAGLKPDLRPANSSEFRTPARRPPYSVLDNARLRALGLDDLKHWSDALADYLTERQHPA